MELLGPAIAIVLIGSLLWLGWKIAPFLLVALFVYLIFRYRRSIPKTIRALSKWLRERKR